LHPQQDKRRSHVAQCLEGRAGPVVASTDYMRSFAEQITPYVSASYTVLGTDGFGRSDTREKLRHFFEVDRFFITITALKSLMDQGEINANIVTEALAKYGIGADLDEPRLR
jgi:pyruvate dehydrogenase E1 component